MDEQLAYDVVPGRRTVPGEYISGKRMQTIGVIGAGTMGAGIAQTAAMAGYYVLLCDVADEVLTRAQVSIAQDLQRAVDRGKVTKEEADDALIRVRTTRDLQQMRAATVVVEAIVERIELKHEIFRELDRVCLPDTVLATNTSSLSVTEIASATHVPERVLGLHFFNPVPRMKLVELIRGHRTSDDVVATATKFVRAMDKQIVVSSDAPGFIVNRIARHFYGESLRILDEKAATVEQIDRAMRGVGLAMGPFELMDMIGIDVNYAVTQSVYEQFFHDPRFRPHPIQRRMVQAQLLGRKTGQGFYTY
jgi:3-hydroxybutyryl-CoA dehydrogenase